MSHLRSAQLGPIVGHVTDRTARIWIRASNPMDVKQEADGNRRTLGVIAIRKHDEANFSPGNVHYFRLRREFDRTGTFTFGLNGGLGDDASRSASLEADTCYRVRVGTLTVDDPEDNNVSFASSELSKRLPSPAVWVDDLGKLPDDQSEASFQTGSATKVGNADFAFLLGSCRYPGIAWKVRHADKIFDPMLEEVHGKEGRPPSRLVLMVGDQIYADMLNRKLAIGRADTFDEFQERYWSAFGSPNMRRLLRSVPTYMILDDHEIEDNWT